MGSAAAAPSAAAGAAAAAAAAGASLAMRVTKRHRAEHLEILEQPSRDLIRYHSVWPLQYTSQGHQFVGSRALTVPQNMPSSRNVGAQVL